VRVEGVYQKLRRVWGQWGKVDQWVISYSYIAASSVVLLHSRVTLDNNVLYIPTSKRKDFESFHYKES
jgi:hypothetical protein